MTEDDTDFEKEMRLVVKKMFVRRFIEYSSTIAGALSAVFLRKTDFLLIVSNEDGLICHSSSRPRKEQIEMVKEFLTKLENDEGESEEEIFGAPGDSPIH